MKQNFLSNPIGRLRLIGITEGISYILLLGIAMPLKYMAGMPGAVKYTGWIHGLLFVLYVFALIHAALVRRWGLKKIAIAFIASLLPFGTFLLDPQLRREEKAAYPEVPSKT